MEKMQNNKIYHAVPANMEGTVLHPLSHLEESNPHIYASHMEKYKDREHVVSDFIDVLNATWADVLQFSPVHPQQIKDALIKAGYTPHEMHFYEIDATALNKENSALCLFEYSDEEKKFNKKYQNYDPSTINQYRNLPEITVRSYIDKLKHDQKPLYFLGVPHIMHKGSLDVSNVPIITV